MNPSDEHGVEHTTHTSRRQVLGALGASSLVVAGCLEGGDSESSTGDDGHTPGDEEAPAGDADDAGGVDEALIPEPTGDCGQATTALSTLLGRDPGESSFCNEDLSPSFAIENERSERVDVTVEVRTGEDILATLDYRLEAGERVVERYVERAADPDRGVTVAEFDAVAVTVDGEEYTGTWDEPSCYRRAVAVVPGGVEVGYVEPMTGPADTMHDCYAGDSKQLRFSVEGASREVHVVLVDHCAEEVIEASYTLDPGITADQDALVGGERYDLVVDVEDGSHTIYEYDEQCPGLYVTISPDGDPEVMLIPTF